MELGSPIAIIIIVVVVFVLFACAICACSGSEPKERTAKSKVRANHRSPHYNQHLFTDNQGIAMHGVTTETASNWTRDCDTGNYSSNCDNTYCDATASCDTSNYTSNVDSSCCDAATSCDAGGSASCDAGGSSSCDACD